MKAGLLLTVSLFSQAKGKSFVGVSGDSGPSSGPGLVGVESVVVGAGDVGVDACVTILGGSGLTTDMDAWNLGGSSWDSDVGDVGFEEFGLGDVGLDEVKLKRDIVMLLLSVGLLFFVGVGLVALAFGRLIFFYVRMGIWIRGQIQTVPFHFLYSLPHRRLSGSLTILICWNRDNLFNCWLI